MPQTEANGTALKLHPREAPVPSSYQQQHDVLAEKEADKIFSAESKDNLYTTEMIVIICIGSLQIGEEP